MNAMHGWSHIRPCQCENHPLYLDNVGLSDLEDCERSFSLSNLVAPLTRHASKFHRHQFIDLHFTHTDRQRYQSLGKFQYDNYRQACRIIEENRALLQEAHSKHGFTATDYRKWLEEEKEYLKIVGKRSDDEKIAFLYLEAYDQWQAAE